MAVVEGHSSVKSLALENAAQWRSVTHNPHLRRFPFPGGQPVNKSREVVAQERPNPVKNYSVPARHKTVNLGASASVSVQVSWCCRKLQSCMQVLPMIGEGNQACGFG